MRIRKQQTFEGFTTMAMGPPVSFEEARRVTTCNDGNAEWPSEALLYPHRKTRPSFNWLDKLRAAKGFPLETDLCVEDALVSRDPSSIHPSPPSSLLASSCLSTLSCDNVASRFRLPDTNAAGNGMEDIGYTDNGSCRSTDFNLVRHIAEDSVSENTAETSGSKSDNNLFADIFAMNNLCKFNKKSCKGSLKRNKRKQEKPRLCPISDISSTSEVNDTYFDRVVKEESPKFIHVLVKPLKEQYQDSARKEEPTAEKNPVEQEDITDLKTHLSAQTDDFENIIGSECEILAIDTSLADWKAETILVKRGECWEIRDMPNALVGVNRVKQIAESSTNDSDMTKFNGKDDVYPDIVSDKWTSQNKVGQILQFDQLERNSLGSSGLKIIKPKKRKGLPSFKDSYETEIVQRTISQSDLRPCKKRIASISHIDGDAEANVKTDAEYPPLRSADLAPDHPANQPRESLTSSVYQVFLQAGKAGLTAREAVSRILESGLPGLHEGGVVPRVEVLKIISNSPYFMLLEESKYILCSVLVGDEEHDSKDDERNSSIEETRHETVKEEKQHSLSQHWAAWAAIRRARTTGKTRRKPSLNTHILETPCHETSKSMSGFSCKKRLKFVKQEVAGLGTPCNRSDGKGWHCPLRAKVGYLLCDHHLNRLRIKSHLKSKMLSTMNKVPAALDKIRNGDSITKQ